MKKLICIFIVLLHFVACAETNSSRSMIQTVQHTQENDHYIMQGISRDIMNKIVRYIESNDFSRPYTEEHYQQKIFEMGAIVWQYNKDVIIQYRYKIQAVTIQIIGHPAMNMKPQWVTVHLFFKTDNWFLKIRVKGNMERDT